VAKLLTKMQKSFCLELIKLGGVHGDKTMAARKAGASPKTAWVQAQKWLRLVKVQTELARLNEKVNKRAEQEEEKTLLDALQVEQYLDAIITANPKRYFDENGDFKPVTELSDEEAYAISEVSRIETQIGSQQRLKFMDRLSAIKTKMQRLGMLKDVQGPPAGGAGETYEEWRERVGMGRNAKKV
jgi:phage terminase small subunit